jgi:hypothetical protein
MQINNSTATAATKSQRTHDVRPKAQTSLTQQAGNGHDENAESSHGGHPQNPSWKNRLKNLVL